MAFKATWVLYGIQNYMSTLWHSKLHEYIMAFEAKSTSLLLFVCVLPENHGFAYMNRAHWELMYTFENNLNLNEKLMNGQTNKV